MTPDTGPQVGGEHTTTIDSLAFGGEGVGRVDGLTVFVPDVCRGETVRLQVTELKKSYARADLLEVVTPAVTRTPPFCPVYGTCGGCHLQQMAYEEQCAAKTQIVGDAMARVGKLPDVPIRDIIPSPLPLGYRNKVELHAVAREDGGIALGFHGRDPETIVELSNCPLALPEVSELIELVGTWLNSTGWTAYHAETGEGLVRTIGIRYSVSTREANLMLLTGRRDVPDKRPWIDALRKEEPRIVGVRHVARTKASQSRLGREVGDMIGRAVRFEVGEQSLRCSPEVFFQVNDLLLETMFQQLHTALEPKVTDHLVDIYGGVGTHGLRFGKSVSKVTIQELDHTAVRDATANAKYNGLDNVEVVVGQAEQQLGRVVAAEPADLVILDPPRKGCNEAVIRITAESRPRRIAYVSCDPATLARDLQRFDKLGYRTLYVQPLDLFPQTYHIEAVAVLERG